MTERQGRLARVGFCGGWIAALGWSLRVAARAPETGVDHLMGLIVASYLAAWGPFFLLSRLGPVGRAARFGACTIAIAFAVGLLELPAAVSLLDYRGVFATPTPAWRRPGNRPDPALLYVRDGHRRERLRFVGADLHRLRGARRHVYECDLALDGRGFRNAVDRTSAEVVVIGDSFVEGLHVPAGSLVSDVLEERIGAPVVNLGRTGYGPQQELEVLKRYALPLRPRTCVWAFYEGNDLQDIAIYDAERRRVERARPEVGSRGWYARSLTRNGLEFAVRTWLRPEPTRAAGLYAGRLGDVDVYFSCGVHEGESLPPDRPHSAEMDRFRGILREAYAACHEAEVELVVAFVPSKFRIYDDVCTFSEDSPCRSWPVDEMPGAVAEAVRSVSGEIRYVDLTPRFLAEAGRLPYLADDTHWSAEGHRIAGEAIAEVVGQGRRSRFAEAGRVVR